MPSSGPLSRGNRILRVAADPIFLSTAHRVHHPVEGNRLVGNVAIGGEPCIHRRQVVDAAELQSMTGEVDRRLFGLGGRRREFVERGEEVGAGHVVDLGHREAIAP